MCRRQGDRELEPVGLGCAAMSAGGATSVDQLMARGQSIAQVARDSFKPDLQEATMQSYMPPLKPACVSSPVVAVVGTFGSFYVPKPKDFYSAAPKPDMDNYMSASM